MSILKGRCSNGTNRQQLKNLGELKSCGEKAFLVFFCKIKTELWQFCQSTQLSVYASVSPLQHRTVSAKDQSAA